MHFYPDISSKLLNLFEESPLHYMIEAMAAGNSPGSVWTDDMDNPHVALIWDQAHCLYLGGDATDAEFQRELHDILLTSILRQAQNRQLHVLKVYTADEHWKQQAEKLLEPIHPQTRARVLYVMSPSSKLLDDNELPEGFSLQRIDDVLLSQSSLLHLTEVVGEISSGWTSIERFLSQGFGYTIVGETDEIVCWCTAEYVSADVCGVGIETIEAYQGRGLATVAAQAFVQQAQSLGWQLYWDSWLGNTPSIRIAERLRFRRHSEYSVSLIILD